MKDGAHVKAFNGRFRAECLNAHWRKYYNEDRPHGAIGNKPPIMLLNHDGAASPPL
jgi:putative transposase